MGIDQLNLHFVQLGYLKILQMGNTDPNNTKQEIKYEVKPQYEELSKQLIMQHAIIDAMNCMRAIKDRIARPAYQLEIISREPLYHAQQIGRWKSSVRDNRGPSAHHSSVVFRNDKSVAHHSDDSVGLFGHDTSVGQSQHGSQSGQQSICQSGSISIHNPNYSHAQSCYELLNSYLKLHNLPQQIRTRHDRTHGLRKQISPDSKFMAEDFKELKSVTKPRKSAQFKHKSEPVHSNTYGQNSTQVLSIYTDTSFSLNETNSNHQALHSQKNTQNDTVPTKQNDAAAFHQLTTDISCKETKSWNSLLTYITKRYHSETTTHHPFRYSNYLNCATTSFHGMTAYHALATVTCCQRQLRSRASAANSNLAPALQ
ncbi:WPP domain-interacting protein 2-like [Dorcoceras hygrometricum]|uniref:WPP domain-interacting protein 2-like n=1 Tax=Dorcoceras hygrometricum TaxID=472368 RepID=A0A2Z7AMT5_9LAMI|nr:WPP domain-interacting protein 2-like [Dorcoceras hygrometricum]